MKSYHPTAKIFTTTILTGLLMIACESSDDPIDVCLTSNLAVSVSATSNTTCGEANGVITVAGSLGTSPYMYSIDGTNFQTSPTFDMLTADTYTITVKDANDCESTVTQQLIDETSILLSISGANTDCGTSVGSITINAAGGSPMYMYKIGDGTYQESNIFDNLAQGTYNVTVQDATGCEVTESHQVLTNIGWSDDILPIINTRCALSGCHDGQSGPPNWTNLNTVQQNSALIKARTGARSMPPAGAMPLTDEQIATIACWVDDGARNN